MAPVIVVRKLYVLEFCDEDIYWPRYWDKALDEEGELIPLNEFEPERMFNQHLWDSIHQMNSFTGAKGMGYSIEVVADYGETEEEIRDLVEDCVNNWNDVAQETNNEVLEWFEQIKEGRDPLEMGDFDIMI